MNRCWVGVVWTAPYTELLARSSKQHAESTQWWGIHGGAPCVARQVRFQHLIEAYAIDL